MSLPATALHRWSLDRGGPVDVIDLGCGVLTMPKGTGRRLLDDLRSRDEHGVMAVGERMSGEALGVDARPFVEAMAEEEGRVVLRCRRYQTFASPPRHLHSNDQDEQITHWAATSGTTPWTAVDPT